MREGQNPLISVVVPVYNAESTLERCLDAIFASDYDRFEVVVFDDASEDTSMQIARRFPCRIISVGRLGAAQARNEGARAANGHILFFVDADVIVQTDTLSRIAATLSDFPQLGAIFGSYTDWTIPENYVSRYKNYHRYFTHQSSSEQARTFWTTCGAVWRRAFFEAGGFGPIQFTLLSRVPPHAIDQVLNIKWLGQIALGAYLIG